MQAREQEDQGKLFRSRLELICNHNDPLYRLANAIEWSEFDSAFGDLYSDGMGRPAKPTRLMVAPHYLKHTFNLSDEEVVAQWVQNPYWQYFCGNEITRENFTASTLRRSSAYRRARRQDERDPVRRGSEYEKAAVGFLIFPFWVAHKIRISIPNLRDWRKNRLSQGRLNKGINRCS